MTNNDASHPDVIYEMLFTNFLFHAASSDMFMLYSSNYRVMESIAKVCILSNFEISSLSCENIDIQLTVNTRYHMETVSVCRTDSEEC